MRIFTFKSSIFTLIIGCLFFVSCSKQTEEFQTEQISDYTNLVVGKYITYRLDSLVFKGFSVTPEIHKYQVKHVVDAEITDNLGRPSYRIFRYLRDSSGTQAWQPNGSYLVTPLHDQLEVTEDNLRFIKLHLPFKEGVSWKGGKYLPDDAYHFISNFNSYDDDLNDWDYYFDRFESSVNYRNQVYTDVWTVEEADETVNIPVTDPMMYGSLVRAVEQYAKGIGLVYREYTLYEYQPNLTGPGGPFKTGQGITMWMIDHN
jgi:hypothetical protein